MGLAFFFIGPAPEDSAFFVLPVFFMVCVYALQMKRTFKQQRDIWSSFELVVTPVSVLRRQKGFRDIEIPRETIRGVIQHRTKGFTILGPNLQESIFVPVGLDGYEEVATLLRQWTGPTSTAEKTHLYLVSAGGILMALAHLGKQWILDPRWLLVAHLAACVSFALTFREMRHSPHVEEKSRKYMWIFLLLAAVELIAAVEVYRSMLD